MSDKQKYTHAITLGHATGELRVDLDREEAIELATQIMTKVTKVSKTGIVTMRVTFRKGRTSA